MGDRRFGVEVDGEGGAGPELYLHSLFVSIQPPGKITEGSGTGYLSLHHADENLCPVHRDHT